MQGVGKGNRLGRLIALLDSYIIQTVDDRLKCNSGKYKYQHS